MKKTIFILCLVMTVTLTACDGTETVSTNAPQDVYEDVEVQEEESDDYEVNVPVGPDNIVGGLYNVTGGTVSEVTGRLTECIEGMSEEQLESYRSFVLVDESGQAYSGVLYASDYLVYEALFDISEATQINSYAMVGVVSTGAGSVSLLFNRDQAHHVQYYGGGYDPDVNTVRLASDWSERFNWIYDYLERNEALYNPLRLVSVGAQQVYDVYRGYYDLDSGEINPGDKACVVSELYSAGDVVFIVDHDIVDSVIG